MKIEGKKAHKKARRELQLAQQGKKKGKGGQNGQPKVGEDAEA